MKPEYHEGTGARKTFEEGMTMLFRVKKTDLKEKPKPERKEPKASKD